MIKSTSKYLWRYIQNNGRIGNPEEAFMMLTKLDLKELGILAEMHFLMSEEAKYFLTDIAPALINRLKKISSNQPYPTRGGITGRVQWQKTFKERMVKGNDPSLFIIDRRSIEFDLPENRLLLFMIKEIESLTIVYGQIKEGSLSSIFDEEFLEKSSWIEYLQGMYNSTVKLLKNPYMKSIGHLMDLNEQLLVSVQKTRGAWFSKLAEVSFDFHLCKKDPLRYLSRKSPHKVLEPLNRNTLYELAVLFKTMEILHENGWHENQVGLIGGLSRVVSEFSRDNSTLSIYYQGLPKLFSSSSRYKDIMRNYGLSNKMRRPDIVIEIRDSDFIEKKYFIIEVKRSEKREYLVDGVYKLLGYFKDYESIYLNENKVLKGLLVGWSGIEKQSAFKEQEIYMSGWLELEQSIKDLMGI